MKELPDKPSELIRLALNDLEKCEKDPYYKIDMSLWYRKSELNDLCYVCFAGAVIAQSLDYIILSPNNICNYGDNQDKLLALDKFRMGDIFTALDYMGIEKPKNIPNYVRVIQYEDDPVMFKTCIIDMINNLQRNNL